MQYEPLRVIRPDDGGGGGRERGPAAKSDTDQRLWPAVHVGGAPWLQPGDTDVQVWPANGLEYCHGGIANRRGHLSIDARVYLTDARLIVVSNRFAKGTRYSPGPGLNGPIIASAMQTVLSRKRAQRAAAGTFLVGQMRLPWISRIVYSQRAGLKGENTVRLCGIHTTAFGDQESVMLIIHLGAGADPHTLAEAVMDRVIRDRTAWSTTDENERAALQGARFPEPHEVAPGRLPYVDLPGGYIVSRGSAGQGVHSSRSVGGAAGT